MRKNCSCIGGGDTYILRIWSHFSTMQQNKDTHWMKYNKASVLLRIFTKTPYLPILELPIEPPSLSYTYTGLSQ